MELYRLAASWHPTLWCVPLMVGITLAAIGTWVSHRTLFVLSLISSIWTLLVSLLATVFLLIGDPTQIDLGLDIVWMTQPAGSLSFSLDLTGAWAISLTAAVTLMTQLYALAVVSHLVGRHRFYALIQVMLAAGAVLFTARSQAVMLVGWEGLALSAAFLAGFWESEQSGGRTGMRWLLFQRASTLLLMLGLVLIQAQPQPAMILIIISCAIRAGLFPFHGWSADVGRAPMPAGALLFTVGSTLAAVFVLVQYEDRIAFDQLTSTTIALISLVGIGISALAGLQLQRPDRALRWLFVMVSSSALLAFGVGDPVAAMLLVTSQALALAGLMLSIGPLLGLESEMVLPHGEKRLKHVYLLPLLVLTSLIFPPTVGFVGIGRLMAAAWSSVWLWPVTIAMAIFAYTSGWMAIRFHLLIKNRIERRSNPNQHIIAPWFAAAPSSLFIATIICGPAAVAVFGWNVVGGLSGLGYAGLISCPAALGVFLGYVFSRRLDWSHQRIERTQHLAQWISQKGLGIGEALVRLPVFLAKALGVLIWRVVGDFLIDTLLLGLSYKIIQGIGMALQILQNGRIQRYTLIAMVAVLLLMISMLR